jgi:hypothetical protein
LSEKLQLLTSLSRQDNFDKAVRATPAYEWDDRIAAVLAKQGFQVVRLPFWPGSLASKNTPADAGLPMMCYPNCLVWEDGILMPGQFARLRAYPDASFKDVTAPNADTLYTSGWLDVSKEPWVLSLPDAHDRYYLFPMLDGWTDVFEVPGKRTTGTGPQKYAITGPHWKGTLPAGVKEYKSPTRNRFLVFPEIQGLDGTKVASIRAKPPDQLSANEKLVHDADLYGGRTALKVTAAVPATMALLYILLILYFKSKGGYKQVHIEGVGHEAKEVA